MTKGKSPRGGARGKLRAYFLANIGRVMDSEELRVVAENQSEWARRIRELRTEEGYQILTHNDRSELKPGQYLLETPKPQPAFERAISKETRAYVLDRNGFTCQMCGAVAGEPHPYDTTRKTRLHLGHVIDKSMGCVWAMLFNLAGVNPALVTDSHRPGIESCRHASNSVFDA